jgi:Kef-type K+ transport system membrane component KefB
MEQEINYTLVILVIGSLIVLIMVLKSLLARTRIPPLVGYICIGLAIKFADGRWNFLSPGCLEIFGFLSKMGVITLLFRVGLESDLKGLLAQLQRASLIWVCDVTISGFSGFALAYYLLGMGLYTSIIVGVALTATSVGVTVAVWNRKEALESRDGETLVDVAELDDISAVILMSLLFTLLPVLRNPSGSVDVIVLTLKTIGFFSLKIVALVSFCYLFSRFAEKKIVRYLKKFEPPSDLMVAIVGVGLIIAAVAGVIGFSLAIGAFFAGLVFSRDPEAVKLEGSFLPICELFSPFFFIHIGLQVEPSGIVSSMELGALFLAVAIGGKLIADGLPATLLFNWKSGLLIGASMVPRAEIAMIVMQKGLYLGNRAVTPEIFGAMVLVCIVTCIASPLTVGAMLDKWSPKKQNKE